MTSCQPGTCSRLYARPGPLARVWAAALGIALPCAFACGPAKGHGSPAKFHVVLPKEMGGQESCEDAKSVRLFADSSHAFFEGIDIWEVCYCYLFISLAWVEYLTPNAF